MPYHGSNSPANINRACSVDNVHLWVFHGSRRIVQNFKANIHHIFLKLFEKKMQGYEYLVLLASVLKSKLRGTEVFLKEYCELNTVKVSSWHAVGYHRKQP